MKKRCLVYCAVFVFFVLVLEGCVSVQKSPESRFYMLQPIDKNQAGQKFDIDSEVIIGLEPVRIPEYQNRPQIVTQDKDRMLTFAQFDRWGEPLGAAFTRVISENLSVLLSGADIEMHTWNSAVPLKYQVIIDVVQLESQLDKDLFFVAQWSVIDTKNKKILIRKKSEFKRQIMPQNYAGLAKTLSEVCASLSGEISETLASLSPE